MKTSSSTDHTTLTSEFIKQYARHPHYTAPVGSTLNARSWQTEAPLRMLLNNLDEQVAEDPENLIVYGGTGQAARNVESVHKIIDILLHMDNEHSLLVQSGKPVGVLRTHAEAPRVLIANSNLVPAWANWEHFQKLKERGLMMYGQMTAGSWIYIGSQGILQGTYETFAACGRKHFGGDLKGRLLVTGGLGGMGGAQPLAATIAGAAFLGVDVDPKRIGKRLQTRYIDKMTHEYEEAKNWVLEAKRKGEALSVGLVGDIGDVLEKLLQDDIIPDVLTDQTSAHDPIWGYVANGLSLEAARELREKDPKAYKERSLKSMARHVGFMLEMQKRGAKTFDYGNNLREYGRQGGEANAFHFKGFVPEYIRPQFCEGKGPFRWAALSGDPEDIYTTDRALMEAFPENGPMIRWLEAAREKIAFQGLPCRICWLGRASGKRQG
jgi:urocanate hydratase